ncbi:MAG: ribonuclease P protein subunit [archaeon]
MTQKRYEINAKNILGHEMIGLNVLVIESSAPERKGIEGKVVDETENTFKILTKNGEKIAPKKECVFKFDLGKEKVVVKGMDVLKKPEERVKEMK